MDSKVIESAKKYAEKKGLSLSRLVEEYFGKITTRRFISTEKHIEELRGIAGPVPPGFDHKKAARDYVFEKHMKR